LAREWNKTYGYRRERSAIIEDLVKRFKMGKPAVDGVSFDVGVRSWSCSARRAAARPRPAASLAEHPTGGRISIGDRVVSEPERGMLVSPRDRDIGMVQSYAVWPHDGTAERGLPLKHVAAAAAATSTPRSMTRWRWSASVTTPSDR
jgi:hypothetical protein